MEELVKYIVESLVSNVEDVKVVSEEDGDVVVIRVNVNPSDVGKVIGKNGKIATSIRAIVKSASAKSGKRYIVKIDN